MSKILLSLPPTLLHAVDDYCNTHQYNRSELFRHAVRLLIYPKDHDQSNQVTVQETEPGTSGADTMSA